MANTYTQCYFHLVFAVKNRDALIRKEWKAELEMYITGLNKTIGSNTDFSAGTACGICCGGGGDVRHRRTASSPRIPGNYLRTISLCHRLRR